MIILGISFLVQVYEQIIYFLVPNIDFSFFLQTYFNILKNSFYDSSILIGRTNTAKNILGIHYFLSLIIYFPFFKIFSSFLTLLFITIIQVIFPAFLIFKTAEKYLDKYKALIISLCYLFHPIIAVECSLGFIEGSFIAFFLSLSLYFYFNDKLYISFLFAIIAGLSKESIWIILFFWGLTCFFKKRKFSIILMITSLFLFSITLFYLIPQNNIISNVSSFTLVKYSEYGNSIPKIIEFVIFHPIFIIKKIIDPNIIRYIFRLTMSHIGLSIFSPLFIPAFIKIFINILSNFFLQHSIYYNYNGEIIIFSTFASIFSLKKIELYLKDVKTIKNTYLLLLSITISSSFCFSNAPWSFSFFIPGYAEKNNILRFSILKLHKQDKIYEGIWKLSEMIPKNSSIIVSSDILMPFANRKKCYIFLEDKIDIRKPDYIIIKIVNKLYNKKAKTLEYYMSPLVNTKTYKDLLKNLNYNIILKNKFIIVFKRKNNH